MRRRARTAALLLAALAIYLGSYLWLRGARREVWERDGRAYVIFPAGAPALYYLYRPLSYADAALTGTGSHLGPHR
ncbi:MAG TPA: hypothetical protein VF746_19780 [Longimicrobium sp.]|jgi:hypothetical protein